MTNGADDIRKFIVIREESEKMKAIKPLLFLEVEEMTEELEECAIRYLAENYPNQTGWKSKMSPTAPLNTRVNSFISFIT
jgi:hypothetical protein